MIKRMPGGVWIAMALALATVACAPATRENVFLEPLYGSQDSEREGPTATAASAPEQPARATAPQALQPDARRTQRTALSPVVRMPGTTATPEVRLRDPIRIGEDGSVTMRFERIGIADFARAVFGEILGLAYVVSPGMAGSITLQVDRAVPKDAVLPIAERALSSAGAAVRRDGDLVVVEPDPRGPMPGGPAAAVAVRRLQHVDQTQMEEALQPFVEPDARISAGPVPGSIVLAGSVSGVRALDRLVDALDIDPLANRAFALLPLNVAGAPMVAQELRLILGAGEKGPQVLEIERMNAVLVVTDSRRTIEEARFWVRQLDRGDAESVQIHTYQVQNRRAAELAKVLQQALQTGGVAAISGATPVGQVAPGLTAYRTGDSAAQPPRADVSAGLGQAGAGQDGAGSASFGDAEGRGASARRTSSALEGVTIFADEGTNAIMTVATPERYALVEAALRKLDIQPVQVLIEATILEVTLSDQLKYGVRWFFEDASISLGFSETETGAVAPTYPGFNFVLDTNDLRTVVSALDDVTDVEIVSSPSLMVLNNETARLQVGDEVPVATTSAVSVVDPDAPIVNEIQFRQTGVILEITPRVNASGLVLLDIVQEVSDVVPTTSSGIDSPTIAQRQFRSSVLLNDRETLAMGGLIRERRSDGKTGIPLLSDIPIIGAAFGSTDLQSDRTELLMVIRPIVVRNHTEAKEAYRELRAKLQGLDRLERQNVQ
ncbi:type II secretion system secretin GspD [Futiania mangrovi]|uniref:Type II secretion system secretin GspD n=1 Tax=Futiania mangrovi TaxID=2959716 RepID=A0A9J6PGK3_9PROT|nr:type II secretion system secretin GspD [Futiania mangrovii]MCP1337873.1 type II secretion system secretin GspD [Futiania mangrovii]